MLEVRDPADVREVVGEVPTLTAAGVAEVYAAARAAFEGGRRMSPLDRAPVLSRAAYLIITTSPEHSLWRDEVFGPVVAAVAAGSFDDAVTLANDTVYGLSAAVFTRDIEQAYRFIDRAEAGQVSVNLPTSGWDVHHPFGGFRDSGSPFKEQGAPGLRFYTRIKTAAVRFA